MMIRCFRFILVAQIGLLAAVHGQITAGLELAQDQFLPRESIPISVRITNFSGQVLKLGTDNSWLQFVLETRAGRPIASISNVPVQGEFELPNATIATKRLDLAPHYPPLAPGRYLVTASIAIPSWGQRILIPAAEFDIIAGTVLWEQAFGIPRPPGATSPPEIRRYALQQASHLKQMKLYVRVTDESGERPLAVFPVGPMLTFSSPEKQIDRQSKLHLLYQTGARSFYYCIVNPDGVMELRHTYDYAGASRPTLRVNDQGQVLVYGGVRRRTADDLPPEAKPATDPQTGPANAIPDGDVAPATDSSPPDTGTPDSKS